MAALLKVMVLIMSVTIFTFIGLGSQFNVGDNVLKGYTEINENRTSISLNPNVTSSIPKPTQIEANTVDTGQTGGLFKIFDALKIPFDMIGSFMRFVDAPFNLASSLDFPIEVALLIFVPLSLVFFVSLAVLIRGGGG